MYACIPNMADDNKHDYVVANGRWIIHEVRVDSPFSTLDLEQYTYIYGGCIK